MDMDMCIGMPTHPEDANAACAAFILVCAWCISTLYICTAGSIMFLISE